MLPNNENWIELSKDKKLKWDRKNYLIDQQMFEQIKS